MSRIYIVGTEHGYQHDGYGSKTLADRTTFSRKLKFFCNKYSISVLAEEYSIEALRKVKGKDTTLSNLSKELVLVHLFCDPDSETRKKLGILTDGEILVGVNIKFTSMASESEWIKTEKINKYYPLRLNYWMLQLNNFRNENVLFVCGSEHTNDFSQLLKENEYDVEILYSAY